MAEKKIRVEVAISKTSLYFLREKYGKRWGVKRLVEQAALDAAADGAKEYLNTTNKALAVGPPKETP